MKQLSLEDLTRVAGGAGTCAIAGDSIAEGLGHVMKQCTTDAKVGIPSKQIIHRVPTSHYGMVIISAGSNDADNAHLGDNLSTMPRRVGGGSVTWIAPIDPRAHAAVDKVAKANGDRVVTFTPGGDNVHPKSYQALARTIGQP